MKRILVGLIFAAFAATASAEGVSAFKAWQVAKGEVNEEARKRLIEIYGPSNQGGIMPNEWYVLFHDPYADQDGRRIRIVEGKMVEIKDGYMQLDRFRLAAYKPEEIINPKLLKIDSDQIYDTLKRSTTLKDVDLYSLELLLKKKDKDNPTPVWFVKLYRRTPSGKKIKFGDAEISAKTSQILNLDIDADRL